MKVLLANLFGSRAPSPRKTRPASFRPQFEALEQRELLAVMAGELVGEAGGASTGTTSSGGSGGGTKGILTSDYTDIARMFPRDPAAGPTNLYLNFDGHQAEHVAPFVARFGQSEREKDIQDILFRVSEIFSPFDVQVRRIFGDGAHGDFGGSTTVFIGDDADNGTGEDNKVLAFTPFAYADWPGTAKGFDHIPNSDPFDLAFVDPTKKETRTTNDAEQIAISVAHEAGHTFGLAHVLSPLDRVGQDIMTQPRTATEFFQHERFVQETLDLTRLNGIPPAANAAHQPQWFEEIPASEIDEDLKGTIKKPYFLKTVNTFAFLQAVVGSRAADDFGSVLHGDRVDVPTSPHLLPGTTGTQQGVTELSGVIDRFGDFDVFEYTPERAEWLTIQLKSGPFLGLHEPQLLLYGGGEIFKFQSLPSGSGPGTVEIIQPLIKGQSLTIVVGGLNSATVGTYALKVTSSESFPCVNVHLCDIPDFPHQLEVTPPAGGGQVAGLSNRPESVVLQTRVRGKTKKLVAVVRFTTGPAREVVSPFQKTQFQAIRAAFQDLNGDGTVDSVLFTALNGKKKVSRTVAL